MKGEWTGGQGAGVGQLGEVEGGETVVGILKKKKKKNNWILS